MQYNWTNAHCITVKKNTLLTEPKQDYKVKGKGMVGVGGGVCVGVPGYIYIPVTYI